MAENPAVSRKNARNGNTSFEQKRILLEFIKKNPSLASGKFSNNFTQKDGQKLWQDISKVLNSCPGSNKDWKSWRKTWQDIRSRTKTKRSTYLSERRKTGGGPYQKSPTTDFEKDVLETIQTVSIEGHQNVCESQVEFDFLSDESPRISPSIIHTPLQEKSDEEQMLISSAASRQQTIILEVTKTPTQVTKTDTQVGQNTNETNTPPIKRVEKSKPFPRASKKLVYASEASDMYKQSLDKKKQD